MVAGDGSVWFSLSQWSSDTNQKPSIERQHQCTTTTTGSGPETLTASTSSVSVSTSHWFYAIFLSLFSIDFGKRRNSVWLFNVTWLKHCHPLLKGPCHETLQSQNFITQPYRSPDAVALDSCSISVTEPQQLFNYLFHLTSFKTCWFR
jgi:hypothetical protein